LAVGPSGAGKTWTWVLPTLLLTWYRSAFVFDVKGELFERTAAHRSTFSHVIRLSPTERGSARYNMLDAVRQGDHAIADAKNIAEALGPDPFDNPRDPVWDIRAKDYLSATILWTLAFAEEREKNLRGVASLLAHGRSFTQAMYENGHPDEEIGRFIRESAATILHNESERFIWSVLGTLDSYLVPYRETILAANTACSDFRPSDLMCGEWPVTIYVCVPVPDLQRLQPFLRVLISQILAELQHHERANREGRPKQHPLAWVIDETADIGGVGALGRSLPRMRSFWMRALLGCQTSAQLKRLSGLDREIINNSRLVCTRQNAIEDARMISEMVGEAEEERESVSRSSEPFIGTTRNVSRSRSKTYRRAISPADVLRLPDDAILVFGEEKVIRARRTPPEFWQPLVAGPPTQTTIFPAPSPWYGIRHPTIQPDEVREREKEATATEGTGTRQVIRQRREKAPAGTAEEPKPARRRL
jgi:type IV secretion system protein VirD4